MLNVYRVAVNGRVQYRVEKLVRKGFFRKRYVWIPCTDKVYSHYGSAAQVKQALIKRDRDEVLKIVNILAYDEYHRNIDTQIDMWEKDKKDIIVDTIMQTPLSQDEAISQCALSTG